MTIVVLAEKPSVARDIAKVIGATRRAEGYFEGEGYAVTWAIGHLVTLAEPHEIVPEWKKWRVADLPMLPESWPLTVLAKTKSQYQTVKKLICGKNVTKVICATDAGREGELIFRYIYEKAGCRAPIERLWISSLTPEAIRAGMAALRPGRAFEGLADSARGRSRADWLVGMNLSRAFSLKYDEVFSIGRVQTPTLSMVVDRELAIRNFVPEDYLEVHAEFARDLARAELPGEAYGGTYFDPAEKEQPAGAAVKPHEAQTSALRAKRLPPSGEEAEAIRERALKGRAVLAEVEDKDVSLPPPKLYDLTELQRHANRLYGYSAKRTLELAQSLYEKWKVISYPRTDSRHLAQADAAKLGEIVAKVSGPYRELIIPETGAKPLGPAFVDDSKVTDHHAIIPTGIEPGRLDGDEARIYDMIVRRLLQAWQPRYVSAVTTAITTVSLDEVVDHYFSRGTRIKELGWKALDPVRPGASGQPVEKVLPPWLAAGQRVETVRADVKKKQTTPPPRLTDATLLTAMESAGRTLDDKALSRAMRERGLGTPATRAAIIETLLSREFIRREGKVLHATDKGIRLIELVDPEVKSPVLTGEWEAALARIHRGEGDLQTFERGIRELIVGLTKKVLSREGGVEARGKAPRAAARAAVQRPARTVTAEAPLRPSEPEVIRAPAPGLDLASERASGHLEAILEKAFGFGAFRPHQKAVCADVVRGADTLVVMPTGAGKSLCFQLPGLARGGTTLVISPLIALMEDQVDKLVSRGIRAERIHSGRSREASRAVCRQYLAGELDFLFIAPERLGVPGFPELLAERRLALIAIDEAHCISHWGHDFRPDYRMLGERLPQLRPAPIIALTATATPLVQDDIVHQLGLGRPHRHIHGFRRDNIAIEVAEVSLGDREGVIRKLFKERPDLAPAIIYTPTRKQAEQLAGRLSDVVRVRPYHAGLPPDARGEIQSEFLQGRLDAIVATIAFGMGIDKADIRTVIHTSLPGSVEGYYQEIGRAGRDGLPSRAILLHSFVDHKHHEFFLKKNYPLPRELSAVLREIPESGTSRSALEHRHDPETLSVILEKLWIHGAIAVSDDGTVRDLGSSTWEERYAAQRRHKERQLEAMSSFALNSHSCRMVQLIRHFGDLDDAGEPCGRCDACRPDDTLVTSYGTVTADEHDVLYRILTHLPSSPERIAVGRLYRTLFPDEALGRKEFERLLTGLSQAGFVEQEEATFTKDGKDISYRTAFLSPRGAKARREDLAGVRLAEPVARSREPSRKSPRKKTMGKVRRRAEAPRAEMASPELFDSLKTWRTKVAKARRVAPFLILNDRTLQHLAASAPRSQDDLLAVTGIGPQKAAEFGSEILEIIRAEARR